jgi:hypothetical protein
MNPSRFLRRAGAAALLPLLLAVAPLAHAGHTAIDSNCDGSFGTPGPPSLGSGQCFNDPVPVVLTGDQTSPAIPMGFSITIAGKSYNQLFINENGVVSFGQGLPSGSFPGGTLANLGTQFTDPTTPFAAAAYLNLNTPAAPVTVDPVGGTAYVMYQTGVADPLGGKEDPAGNIPAASSTGLPPAIAIVWSDPSQAPVGSGLGFQAQLVIYSLNGASNTPGDFAIRFRYGSQSFGDNPVVVSQAGSQAGYSLGSGVVTLAGLGYPEPYNNAPTSADPNGVDYYFTFIQTVAPPPPPTVTISVSPASIVLGSSATVTWSSTNATGCTASSAWSGAQATSGTLKVTPTATGTLSYALACTGAGGTVNGSAMLTVTSAPPPERCDVNHNGEIDIRDLVAIFDSLGKHVSATDPRDANGNLRVDVFDLLICASRCTHRACAIK